MEHTSILTEEFLRDLSKVGEFARERAFRAGQPVIYMDDKGRYIEEYADGRKVEVKLNPSNPRESHSTVVGDLDLITK
ncbi:hypothetical protein F183_A45120 [Bryobacterales bacterium F-183]|nr:hypothetical protein F183_A45120 [Bryobacterales bacterium F-183]